MILFEHMILLTSMQSCESWLVMALDAWYLSALSVWSLDAALTHWAVMLAAIEQEDPKADGSKCLPDIEDWSLPQWGESQKMGKGKGITLGNV